MDNNSASPNIANYYITNYIGNFTNSPIVESNGPVRQIITFHEEPVSPNNKTQTQKYPGSNVSFSVWQNAEKITFTFISTNTKGKIYAEGVQETWTQLKKAFNRNGDDPPKNAQTYRKIGSSGPELFAILNDQVFYEDQGKWSKYESAKISE